MKRILLMAVVSIAMNVSPDAARLIQSYAGLNAAVIRRIGEVVPLWLNDIVSDIKRNDFKGHPGPGGGATPIGIRTGNLRADLHAVQTSDLEGYIGTSEATRSYARAILDEGETTITPKSAKHLWVPTADNLDASGVEKLSPRAAMDLKTPTGKRALRIFESNAGNLVAFLPGELDSEGGFRAQKGRYTRGKNKGRMRGKLLFVLKQEVTVSGTNALFEGALRNAQRGADLVTSAIQRAFRETLR